MLYSMRNIVEAKMLTLGDQVGGLGSNPAGDGMSIHLNTASCSITICLYTATTLLKGS